MDARRRSGFDRLAPVSDRYASLPVDQAFTWTACDQTVKPGEWYMVAFRSVRRPGADEARLSEYDGWAHDEAMTAPGFVNYFKGPTSSDGSCLSFCLWLDRTTARAAAGGRRHAAAAAIALEMYSRFDLEFHRVTKRSGGTFEFEPYDTPLDDTAPAPRFAPGFATS
jgi:hypothetical protein